MHHPTEGRWMVHRYGLRNDQWLRIEGMLPGRGPMHFLLTPVQTHDLHGANALLPGLQGPRPARRQRPATPTNACWHRWKPQAPKPSSHPNPTAQRRATTTANSTKSATKSKISSSNSNSTAPSPPATTKPP